MFSAVFHRKSDLGDYYFIHPCTPLHLALEIIINNIKIRIHELYDTESIIHVFIDDLTFVRIFDELEEKLKSIVNNRVSYSNFRETDVDRLFLDLRTLYLPMLEKAVHEVVQ